MNKFKGAVLQTSAILCLWPTASLAQGGVLTDAAAIAACLCQERAIAERQQEIDARKTVYERVQAQAESLKREAERRKPSVNVERPDEVAAFRALLDERDAAQENMLHSALPDYQAAVAAYNDRVARYSSSCRAGYDSEVFQSVKARLICPAH